MAARKRKEREEFATYRIALQQEEEAMKMTKAGYYISMKGHPLKNKLSVRNIHRYANGGAEIV
jgi:predicted HTH domain antitoxin